MALPLEVTFAIDLLALFAIFLIISISLNIEFGYTGIPNFGKLLAVAGGAFFVGAIPGRVLAYLFDAMEGLHYIRDNPKIITAVNTVLSNEPAISMLVLFLSLVMAALIGAGLGFAASYPAIRLREDYLAITLLAMGEMIRTIGYNYEDLVGGTLGISVPDPFKWVGGDLRYFLATIIIVAVAAVIYLYAETLARSPLGRALKAVRDDEVAAAALGKDVVKLRMKALMIGSAIAAIGGALYAFLAGSVTALAYNRVTHTFWPWVMVIMGGTANNLGVLLGVAIFVSLRKFIIFYKADLQPYIPFDVVWLELLLLGIALIVVLIYRPEGVIPEKPAYPLDRETLERIREKVKEESVRERAEEAD